MALNELLQRVVLGIALVAGCAPSTTETEGGSCEDRSFSSERWDRAFASARERLEEEGPALRSGAWNKEETYARLEDYILEDLGCSPVSSRRHGGSCQKVDLLEYISSVFYCGPGAVEGDCSRVQPGDCLNEVCYQHDRNYDGALQESEEDALCLWSEQTAKYDAAFFSGYGRCTEDDECGFYCQLIGAIARNLQTIELAYAAVGPGCLWEGDDDEKPKQEEHFDGGSGGEKVEDLIAACRRYYQRYDVKCSANPSQEAADRAIAQVCTPDNSTYLEKYFSGPQCTDKKSCEEFIDCLQNL